MNKEIINEPNDRYIGPNFKIYCIDDYSTFNADKKLQIDCANGKFETTIRKMLKKIAKRYPEKIERLVKELFHDTEILSFDFKDIFHLVDTNWGTGGMHEIQFAQELDNTLTCQIDDVHVDIQNIKDFKFDLPWLNDSESVKKSLFWMTKECGEIMFMYDIWADREHKNWLYIETDYEYIFSELWFYNMLAVTFPDIEYNK